MAATPVIVLAAMILLFETDGVAPRETAALVFDSDAPDDRETWADPLGVFD
jgi:hypothetical protein